MRCQVKNIIYQLRKRFTKETLTRYLWMLCNYMKPNYIGPSKLRLISTPFRLKTQKFTKLRQLDVGRIMLI